MDQKPVLSDLRESGSIEQDSDLICLICNENSNTVPSSSKNTIELIVAKHRNGATGKIKLNFNKSMMKFTEKTL